MITSAQRAEIRRLYYAEHWRVNTIGTHLGLHHETVRRAIGTDQMVSNSTVRPSALDPYVEFVRATLEQYPRLTATRVHRMLTSRGYPGSVVQLRRRIRQLELRPRRKESYVTVVVSPGEQGQVDWADFGTLPVAGGTRRLYGFVVVLSYSRAVHVEFGFEQTAAAVARGHIAAFKAFGGVPRQMLYDNMKTVVIERFGDAIRYHDRLLELAGHYHFAPAVCTVRRANEKGRVERRIRDLRSSLFAGTHFERLDEVTQAFERWRDEVAHRRVCPDHPDRKTVAEAFESERGRLLPLPENPADGHEIRIVCAKKLNLVPFDANRYSIPPELVGVPLQLVADTQSVRLLHEAKLVAEHSRNWGRNQTLIAAEHQHHGRPATRHGRSSAARTRLVTTLPHAAALYEALVQCGEPLATQTRQLCDLLDRYGADRLDAAIAEALARNTPRAASVAHLLDQQRRATDRVALPPLSWPERPELDQLTTQTHCLEDYDAIGQDDHKS